VTTIRTPLPNQPDVHLTAFLADIRPLGARSVIASTLLGAEAARMRAERLIRAGALFGIADGAIRTALWRMVNAGELIAEDGAYELAGRLLARQQRFSDNVAARRRTWDGTWAIEIVEPGPRRATARQDLRIAARALHLAELREGVWLRPDNLDPSRLPEHQATIESQCVRLTGASTPSLPPDRLFDTVGWADGARSLVAALDDASHPPDDLGPGDLAGGFRLSIAVVRHLDADPLLPDELLPAAWPGSQLRERYAAYHRAYERRFAAWLATAV
jgi:phenylacetic acid degradation operon negative regulatory protein